MKKFTLALGAILFMSLIFTGCGTDAKDIKLSDLEEVCDYTEAMNIVVDEALEIMDGRKRDDLSEKEKAEIKELRHKFRDISRAADKKYTKAELKECDDYKDLRKKMKEL